MTETATEIPVVSIVERYIQLRDKKAEKKAAYDKDVAAIEAAMTRCEGFILATMQNMGGIDSIKTAHGTAYKTTRTGATVADWGQTLPWIVAGERWDILEKRVSKPYVEAFKLEHNDLPPGINWREEITLNIRRT